MQGDFDYIFLVCMGVGITPGISLISQYWATKTIVLIWVCRNQELIDLYHEELQVGRDVELSVEVCLYI